MSAATRPVSTGGAGRRRLRAWAPWLLLAPGILWLVVFFVWPTFQMLLMSFSSGSADSGYHFSGSTAAYQKALTTFPKQFGNSLLFGGAATILDFLIGFPVAYTVAFRGGRYKNVLLFLVIAPFFTSFLIRTISWKTFLGDEGPLLSLLKGIGAVSPDATITGTALAVVLGLTYNFLPFMILPLYVALEKIDVRLIEAANDLYASRWQAFRRVTFPLALPGVFAGGILTFIPSLGDYINATLLGNPQTQMIGNVIQNRFLGQLDYPVAAALSFILMAGIVVAVGIYAKALGTEQLTG
jgi:spermidine/putrescine transport system permease protein